MHYTTHYYYINTSDASALVFCRSWRRRVHRELSSVMVASSSNRLCCVRGCDLGPLVEPTVGIVSIFFESELETIDKHINFIEKLSKSNAQIWLQD